VNLIYVVLDLISFVYSHLRYYYFINCIQPKNMAFASDLLTLHTFAFNEWRSVPSSLEPFVITLFNLPLSYG